jgi:hypothetical protein
MSQVGAQVCNPLSRSAYHLRANGDFRRRICDVYIHFVTHLKGNLTTYRRQQSLILLPASTRLCSSSRGPPAMGTFPDNHPNLRTCQLPSTVGARPSMQLVR